MSLSIATRVIQQPAELSELTRLALSLVDGGMEWLQWAIASHVTNYSFADEGMMLDAAQQGLHGSRYALLLQLKLAVSPVKLLTLSAGELRILCQVEAGQSDEALQAQCRQILTHHHLLTQADFAATRVWLQKLGVADAAQFQDLGLNQRTVLYQAMDPGQPEPSDEALQQEAAGFGIEQGRTPEEFADYYRFYLSSVPKLGTANGSASTRRQAADQAMQTLLPLLFGNLDAPQLHALPSPREVNRAVSDWLMRGRMLGFTRLSTGALQLMENSTYAGESGTEAARIVQQYLSSAQSFLSSSQADRGILGQDGASSMFPLRTGQLQGRLLITPDGQITLNQFGQQVSAPTALPASDPKEQAS